MDRRWANRAIRGASDQSIRDICNICNNYYRNPDIKLTPHEVGGLRKHKKLIMCLVNRRLSLKHKRAKMVQQRGGLFPLLALIPAIAAKIGLAAAVAAPAVAKAAALGAVSAGVGIGVERLANR